MVRTDAGTLAQLAQLSKSFSVSKQLLFSRAPNDTALTGAPLLTDLPQLSASQLW